MEIAQFNNIILTVNTGSASEAIMLSRIKSYVVKYGYLSLIQDYLSESIIAENIIYDNILLNNTEKLSVARAVSLYLKCIELGGAAFYSSFTARHTALLLLYPNHNSVEYRRSVSYTANSHHIVNHLLSTGNSFVISKTLNLNNSLSIVIAGQLTINRNDDNTLDVSINITQAYFPLATSDVSEGLEQVRTTEPPNSSTFVSSHSGIVGSISSDMLAHRSIRRSVISDSVSDIFIDSNTDKPSNPLDGLMYNEIPIKLLEELLKINANSDYKSYLSYKKAGDYYTTKQILHSALRMNMYSLERLHHNDIDKYRIVGYGNISDPSKLKPDFRGVDCYIDSTKSNLVTKVFTDINLDGTLVCNDNYTHLSNELYDPEEFLPYIIIDGDIAGFVAKRIIRTAIFKSFYVENLMSGTFHKKDQIDPYYTTKQLKVQYRQYNSEFDTFRRAMLNKPITYSNTMGKRYSFGIEIETISGVLPKYLDHELFYSAVHDGSLRDHETGKTYGGEYVSNVLYGDQGLLVLKKLSYQLSKRCLVDKRCGEVFATL